MSALAAALSSRRTRFWITSISALVFAVGVVAFIIVYFSNTAPAERRKEVFTNKPAQTSFKETNVPLAREARVVAGRFIETAVQRKDLAESWKLVGPSLKQGFTLEKWREGTIPVVPYLEAIDKVTLKVDYSHPRDALIEVLILPKSSKVKGQIFFLELKKYGKRWLVTSWAPRGYFIVPDTLGS